MAKCKIYIAGPITGDPDYKAKFGAVKQTLEEQGYIVLNPAELPEGMTAGDYMRICMAMLDVADGIYMLPGWERSRGAEIEHRVAAYSIKPIIYVAGEGEEE